MTGSSFHERHRSFLAAVTDRCTMADVLARIGESRSWWSDDRRWSRTWGRLDTGSGRARATLTYESRSPHLEICTLEVSEAAPRHAEPLRIDAVHRFPDDGVLSALTPMIRALPGARVVRYRPHKRCTLHVPAAAPEQHFVKLFADGRGARYFADAAGLLDAAEQGRLEFAVAAPLGYDPVHRMFTQAVVAGDPVVSLLYSADGPELATRLGCALGSLSTSGLRPAPTLDHGAELVRAHKRAGELWSLVPALRAPLESLLGDIRRTHRALRPKPLVPIHGSPHPHQWLLDGDSIGLIDFDRFSMGDAELDVATFAGEVDFQRQVPAADINEAFVAGFERRTGSLDDRRLSLYRAHKRLAKAYRTARAIKTNGHERAAAHVERAHLALSQKEPAT